jgi:tripartite-type tricarboxylate transporter receptor subunit TctC
MKRRQLIAAAACTSSLASLPAWAQGAWPNQPIKFVVPFTAGSGTDIIARAVAQRLTPVLGQSIVIENKPGAGGTIAAAQVAKAPPDGYNFLVHSSGHVVNPAIYPNLPYDTLKDLIGISPLASLPNLMVTSPSKGYKDLRDLVAKVKAKPDAFFYGSAGNGSATHINAAKFALAAGVNPTHVPFRGTPEAMTETISGRIDWFFAPIVSALPLVREGKLQALAVGTGSRSDDLPQVPHMAEVGFRDAVYTFWVGMFAPSALPKPVVDRMNSEISKILNSKEFKESLDKVGAEPMPMAVAPFDQFLRTEAAAIAQLVQAAGIKAN